MSRPRQYATAAERQAAYRQRKTATTITVDRAAVVRLEAALTRLQDATWRALHHGSPLARTLYQCDPVATLDAAVAWMVDCLQADTIDTASGESLGIHIKCSGNDHPNN